MIPATVLFVNRLPPVNCIYSTKLKCRVCGGWLISATPWAHRINPNLPLDKVNRVNNLVSLHKKCFMAVNDPSQDISEFDVKAQKKIIGYREKLVSSHTRNK